MIEDPFSAETAALPPRPAPRSKRVLLYGRNVLKVMMLSSLCRPSILYFTEFFLRLETACVFRHGDGYFVIYPVVGGSPRMVELLRLGINYYSCTCGHN
jgi:hypothetical protein